MNDITNTPVNTMKIPPTPLETAQWAESLGIITIKVERGEKNPDYKGWQNERSRDLSRYADGKCNIGFMLGEASRVGDLILVDVDLDHAAAIKNADEFLPPTGRIYGRKSKRRSHKLYWGRGDVKTAQYRFPTVKTPGGKPLKGAMIVERRSTGGQSIGPGSGHGSGEIIEWDEEGEIAIVDAAVLSAAIEALAKDIGAVTTPPAPPTLEKRPARTIDSANDKSRVDRCIKYLSKMDDAVNGHGGHDATFHAACIIFRFTVSDADALQLLYWFNDQKCFPKWNEKEMQHKFSSAKAVIEGKGERGTMLDSDRPRAEDYSGQWEFNAARCQSVTVGAVAPKSVPNKSAEQNNALEPAPKTFEPDGAVLVSMADVVAEDIEFVEPRLKIAKGKLSLFASRPGLGKSVVAMTLAAAVSRGRGLLGEPNGLSEPADVIMLLAEDGLADTVKGRLTAADADQTRIFAITAVTTTIEGAKEKKIFNLGQDIAALRRAIKGLSRCRLVILDTINSYIGGKINSDKDSAVREVLLPLTELAEETGVAILAISHMSKGGVGAAVNQVMGSLAFAGVARVVWLLAPDPIDRDRLIIAPAKCNIGKRPQAMAFRIADGPKLVWETEGLDLSADDMIAQAEDAKENRKSDEVADWLKEQLADGPKPATDMIGASQSLGYSKWSTDAAGKKLGMARGRPIGRFGGAFYWSIPPYVKDGKVSLVPVVDGSSLGALRPSNTLNDHPIRENGRTDHPIGIGWPIPVLDGPHALTPRPSTTQNTQSSAYVEDEV